LRFQPRPAFGNPASMNLPYRLLKRVRTLCGTFRIMIFIANPQGV